MERVIVNENIDDTFFGKFMENEDKIRNLAAFDPNSYAADVVTAVDQFTMGAAMMEEVCGEPVKSCCSKRILKEFADSLRASEIFGIWTSDLRCKVQEMAENAIKKEGRKNSDLDRYARICLGMMKILSAETEARQFMDACRKKYPTEVFFHRIYCYMFSSTQEWDAGLEASDEACKLFPNDANILNARAVMLRMMTDKGDVDYQHWSQLKKQVKDVKQAFKDFLKIAPKDHRHFADNNYFVAYFAFKYATPLSQMMQLDMQEINVYFEGGLNAELDIIPCFLPFTSQAKDFVGEFINFHRTMINVYHEGDTCTINLTTHDMPGRPKLGRIPTDNVTLMDERKPPKRRIDVCVPHRQQLRNMLSDPVVTVMMAHLDGDHIMADLTPSSKEDSNNFKEIILHQMTMANESRKFTSKVIQLSAMEDPLYISGNFETIVADITGDVIKLKLDVSEGCSNNFVWKELLKKFRFGTVWKLQDPEFHMENEDSSTMYIRARPDCMIPMNDGHQNGHKCRMCFKPLNTGVKCGKCKFAVYCGKDCQTQDWKYIKHKLICSDAHAYFYKQS